MPLRNRALPDQTTRASFNRRSDLIELAVRGLFVDAGAAAGGGAAAPAAAAPAPAAGAGDGKGGAPAGDGKGAPAAGDGKGAPAAGAGDKKVESIIAAPAEPAKPTADEMRKFLVEKGGKDEDVKKLTDADLQKQFDAAKEKDKPAPKAGEVKAEDIKVTVPEGIEIDEKTLTDFRGLIADAKLTPQERAQKLIDLHASALKAAAEKPFNDAVAQIGKWQETVKADKELGGTGYEAMKSTISKALGQIGGKELKAMEEAFVYTGAGNHPEIVRAFYRMAKLIVEGDPVTGGAPAEGKGLAQTLASMYPSANNGAAKAAA